jgi:hypothetical protein
MAKVTTILSYDLKPSQETLAVLISLFMNQIVVGPMSLEAKWLWHFRNRVIIANYEKYCESYTHFKWQPQNPIETKAWQC